MVPVVIAQAVVSIFLKKVAQAASEEFIEKMLEIILRYSGDYVIKFLNKWADKSERDWDDTLVDLIEERQSVLKSILQLDHMPAGMELFPETDDTAWTLIKPP